MRCPVVVVLAFFLGGCVVPDIPSQIAWDVCIDQTCIVEPGSQRELELHIPGLQPVVEDAGWQTPTQKGSFALLHTRCCSATVQYNHPSGEREAQPMKNEWVLLDLIHGKLAGINADPFASTPGAAFDGSTVAFSEVTPSAFNGLEFPRPYGKGAVYLLDVHLGVTERIPLFDDAAVFVHDVNGSRTLLEVMSGNEDVLAGWYVADVQNGVARAILVNPFLEAGVDAWILDAKLTPHGVVAALVDDHALRVVHLVEARVTELIYLDGSDRVGHGGEIQVDGQRVLYIERSSSDGQVTGYIGSLDAYPNYERINAPSWMVNGMIVQGPLMAHGQMLYRSYEAEGTYIWLRDGVQERIHVDVRDPIDISVGLGPSGPMFVVNDVLYRWGA